MNDDYLWDRRGDPNEEVQELEELLGTLRYQPRELEIPHHFEISGRRNRYRALAIAAAIALTVIGVGIWTSLQRSQSHESAKSQNSSLPQAMATATATSQPPGLAPETALNHEVTQQSRHLMSSAKSRHVRRDKQQEAPLSPSEIAAAKTAKEQLLLALRMTSAKLSLVQRRTQNPVPANLIRNQHKIG